MQLHPVELSGVRALPSLALFLTLGACGPPLGSYDLTEVTRVDSAELRGRDHVAVDAPYLLRIELLSRANLAEMEGVVPGNVYVHADFCPWRADDIMSFGPYFGDRSKLEPAFRDSARNAFVYVAYLEPYAPARAESPGYPSIKGHDLRTDTRDLCIRMTQAGYFATASQSEVTVVPRAAIARALGLPK